MMMMGGPGFGYNPALGGMPSHPGMIMGGMGGAGMTMSSNSSAQDSMPNAMPMGYPAPMAWNPMMMGAMGGQMDPAALLQGNMMGQAMA